MHNYYPEYGTVKQLLIYREVSGKRIMVFEPDNPESLYTQEMPLAWAKKKSMDADDTDILYNIVTTYLVKRYGSFPQYKNAAMTIHCPVNGFCPQIPLVVGIEYEAG